jgi:hypothetical protein
MYALNPPVHQRSHLLDVGFLASAGFDVGVGHLVPAHLLLATDIALHGTPFGFAERGYVTDPVRFENPQSDRSIRAAMRIAKRMNSKEFFATGDLAPMLAEDRIGQVPPFG